MSKNIILVLECLDVEHAPKCKICFVSTQNVKCKELIRSFLVLPFEKLHPYRMIVRKQMKALSVVVWIQLIVLKDLEDS
jgi:hypothetical protein